MGWFRPQFLNVAGRLSVGLEWRGARAGADKARHYSFALSS
jgi:hypothetical protein